MNPKTMMAACAAAAAMVGGAVAPAEAQWCKHPANESGPRVFVSAFGYGDRSTSANVADSVRAMLTRLVPPGEMTVVTVCDVKNAWPGPWRDTVWLAADLMRLANIMNLNSIIEVGANRTSTGQVRLWPAVVRMGELPEELPRILADDVRGAALALATRIATDRSLRREPRGGTPQGAGPLADQVYFEFQVEKPAMPRANAPRPEYPPVLRAAHVGGDVLAQFVVTASGAVDTSSFKILKSTHDLFTSAVKAVVPRIKFSPAEIAGIKVKQLVQMPFHFSAP